MNHRLKIFILLFILVTSSVDKMRAQNKKIDSLKKSLSTEKTDTTRCNALLNLAILIDNPEVESYCLMAIELCEIKLQDKTLKDFERKFYKSALAAAYGGYAAINYKTGKSSIAFEYFEKSLKLKEEVGDLTGKAIVLNNYCRVLHETGKTKEALVKLDEAIKLLSITNDKNGLLLVYNNLGQIHRSQGKIAEALSDFEKMYNYSVEIGMKKGMSAAKNFIGSIYSDLGNTQKALDNFYEGAKICESMGDLSAKSDILSNIGIIYLNQNDFVNALKLIRESHSLAQKVGYKKQIANTLHNQGVAYQIQLKYDSALIYFNLSVELKKNSGDLKGTIITLSSLAQLRESQQEFEKAFEIYKECLLLCEKIDDKKMACSTKNLFSSLLLKMNRSEEAEKYALEALSGAKDLGFPNAIMNSSKVLKKIYINRGNYQKALELSELYIAMRDSINNENSRKASMRSQLKYEYEKIAAADSVSRSKTSQIKNAEIAKQKVELKAKKNQQFALFVGLLLVCVFGILMFNRYKITQKQKLVIEMQKSEVEMQKKAVDEKQKELLDSIHYAKRIQLAQIPTEKQVAKSLERLRKI